MWLVAVIAGQLQAGYLPPDTVRIRMLKQELSQLHYINEQKEYYYQLEQLAIKTGDKSLLAKCCYELSYILVQQSEYPLTIEYVQRALRYYEAKNDKTGRANCYRIMGTLYLLLSPEQADLYFRKCSELSSREDSALAVITKCMMSIQPGAKNDKVFNDIRNINLKVLNVSQAATVDYLYAVMARQEKDIDKALLYIQKANAFFTTIPQLGYMNALIQHEMASLYFTHGDLEKAKQTLAMSDAICKRDNYPLTAISNMKLLSSILSDEGREVESLMLFKKYTSKKDSLLGLNQVRSLTSLLMRNLLDENVQEHLSMNHQGHQKYYIAMAVILILSIMTLYYFRNTFMVWKEKYLLLSQITEQNKQLGSNPELKQHLSVIMFEYKKGLNHYIKQFRNKENTWNDYQNFSLYMDEANDFIDQLKKWIDEQPYQTNSSNLFEAGKITRKAVYLLEIIYSSEQVSIQNNIGDETFVYGNHIYFSIAIEILLFRILQAAGEQAVIILSVRDNIDFTVFTISSPNYVISEDDRIYALGLIQKMRTNNNGIHPENNAEICLKCIYENNGNIWFESDPERGTILNFTVPKGEIKIKTRTKPEQITISANN